MIWEVHRRQRRFREFRQKLERKIRREWWRLEGIISGTSDIQCKFVWLVNPTKRVWKWGWQKVHSSAKCLIENEHEFEYWKSQKWHIVTKTEQSSRNKCLLMQSRNKGAVRDQKYFSEKKTSRWEKLWEGQMKLDSQRWSWRHRRGFWSRPPRTIQELWGRTQSCGWTRAARTRWSKPEKLVEKNHPTTWTQKLV